MSFNQFVQKLRAPEFLIKGCRIFWEKYEDNVSFAVQTLWQSFLKEESQRPDKYIILGGIEAVLLKWNQSLYKNNPQLMAKID